MNNKEFKMIMVPERIVTPQLSQYGYYRIGLTKNFKRTHYSVHRLVAKAFIPNPENKPQVNHKDENKLNNHASNLEWCTSKYNANYGTRNKRVGERQTKSVKCVETGVIYKSLTEASEATGVSISNLSSVCNHRKWFNTAGGYHWEYAKPEKKTRKKKVVE